MSEKTPFDIERFVAEDDGKPVVMLNLLRFKPDGGRERYFEYIALARPFVEKVGGSVVYAGDGLPALVGGPDQVWDGVALVRYPTRKAFLAMVEDPGYQRTAPVRADALIDAVLQPTRELG